MMSRSVEVAQMYRVLVLLVPKRSSRRDDAKSIYIYINYILYIFSRDREETAVVLRLEFKTLLPHCGIKVSG